MTDALTLADYPAKLVRVACRRRAQRARDRGGDRAARNKKPRRSGASLAAGATARYRYSHSIGYRILKAVIGSASKGELQ
jgi:hypothetical protein